MPLGFPGDGSDWLICCSVGRANKAEDRVATQKDQF